MLVEEFVRLKVNGLPQTFYDSLPTICLEDNCGYPTEMLDTLTQLKCSNPRCPAKVAQRLQSIINTLGVKDFGEQRIRDFVDCYQVTNPLIIFAWEPCDGQLAPTISPELSEKIYRQIEAKKDFTLTEYVRLANLPFIQTSAGCIFDKYDTIEDAYKPIDEGGVAYIQKCLGIKAGGECSLQAMKVYESLMTYRNDLAEMQDVVRIIKKNVGGMVSFKACVSGDVGCGFKTKAEFYHTVNSLDEKIHIDFLGSATKDIKYLIWEGSRYTNKVVTVTKRIENGDDVKIVNATQFIEEVKRMLAENMLEEQ